MNIIIIDGNVMIVLSNISIVNFSNHCKPQLNLSTFLVITYKS